MSKKNQDGVKIRYNGEVSKNSGKLDFGDHATFPWRIYVNDAKLAGAISYIQSPDYFYGGDPVYIRLKLFSKSKEYNDTCKAPWLRREWDDPLEKCH